MKKLAVTQIVLGALLIASFLLYVLVVESGYWRLEIIDLEGNIVGFKHIMGLHRFNPLLAVWMLGYPVLGILITGCGIAQLVRVMHGLASKGLSIMQIVLGVLVLIMMFVFVVSVQPAWHTIPAFANDPGLPAVAEANGLPEGASIQYNPGWVALMTAWKVASFILGTAVAGCASAVLFRINKGYG
jgi:hypothetical protein